MWRYRVFILLGTIEIHVVEWTLVRWTNTLSKLAGGHVTAGTGQQQLHHAPDITGMARSQRRNISTRYVDVTRTLLPLTGLHAVEVRVISFVPHTTQCCTTYAGWVRLQSLIQ